MKKKLFSLFLCACMLLSSCDEEFDPTVTEPNNASEEFSDESSEAESKSDEESNEPSYEDADAQPIRLSGGLEIYITKDSTQEDLLNQFGNYGYISTDSLLRGGRIFVERTTIIPGLNEDTGLYECGSATSGYIIPNVLKLNCGIYVLPFYEIVKTQETSESMEAIKFRITEGFSEIRITKDYIKGYYEYSNGSNPAESMKVDFKIIVKNIDSEKTLLSLNIRFFDYEKFDLILSDGTKIPLDWK